MGPKILVLIAFFVITAIKFVLQLVQHRSAQNPIPESVDDVYDRDTYLKWQQYHGEQSRLEMIETLVEAAVMAVLLLANVHVLFAKLFGSSVQGAMFGVLLCQTLVDTVVSLPFRYFDTMKIEEKYGFNRSTMKTFVRDQIINFIMGLLMSGFIILAIQLTHSYLGDHMVLVFAGVMCLFVLAVNLLFPTLSRLQNKFTPLEEGSLREKLTALLTSHGYEVKDIQVMDASRRTSKLNAYFSGFGKQKRIVLFDTLLDAMDEDEICAVFAHELGHGLHKDIPKQLLISCGNMVIIAVLAWLTVRQESLYTAFGFPWLNYGFAYLLMSIVALPLVMQVVGIFTNAVTRKAEYAADAQAVKEGYGTALISALKKLARENFSHLSPSKLLVVLDYSHPPLAQRIAAIEALQAEKDNRSV